MPTDFTGEALQEQLTLAAEMIGGKMSDELKNEKNIILEGDIRARIIDHNQEWAVLWIRETDKNIQLRVSMLAGRFRYLSKKKKAEASC